MSPQQHVTLCRSRGLLGPRVLTCPTGDTTPLSVTARRRVRSAGNARPNCSLRTDRPGHRHHPNARARTRPGAGPDLGSQTDQKGTRQPEGNALSKRTRRPFRNGQYASPPGNRKRQVYRWSYLV